MKKFPKEGPQLICEKSRENRGTKGRGTQPKISMAAGKGYGMGGGRVGGWRVGGESRWWEKENGRVREWEGGGRGVGVGGGREREREKMKGGVIGEWVNQWDGGRTYCMDAIAMAE